jgi:hypothetical protein
VSHVVGVDLAVSDLDALVEGAEARCNLVRVNTRNWDWFGSWLDDYKGRDAAYKLGIKPEDYGKCDFALVQADSPLGRAELAARREGRRLTHEEAVEVRRQNGTRTNPYSIGVVPDPKKPGRYLLLYDFWQGGYGLKAKVGENCDNLRQAYGIHSASRVAARHAGHQVVSESKLADGRVHMKIRVPVRRA